MKEHPHAIEVLRHKISQPYYKIKRRLKNRDHELYYNFFPHTSCVFVHIPKAAGTSVHRLLTTVENRRLEVEKNSTIEKLGSSKFHKHVKAKTLEKSCGQEAWRNTFSFTFVRNPWDLMVSSFFWWRQIAHEFPETLHDALIIRRMDFDQFIRSQYGRERINEYRGEMRDWFQRDGEDIVSYVGKVETFESDISHIFEKLGESLEGVTIPHSNKTSRSTYQDYYTSDTKDLVWKRFEYEIERFGYEF